MIYDQDNVYIDTQKAYRWKPEYSELMWSFKNRDDLTSKEQELKSWVILSHIHFLTHPDLYPPHNVLPSTLH